MREWSDPAWHAEAHAWIGERLAGLGIRPVGPVEQPHVQPWSTVLRVPTEGGAVWFKANEPALSHEAALLALLAGRRPDCVAGVLAVDTERGWILLADAGSRLREVLEEERDLGRWLDVLPLYASVQLDLARDTDELLGLGLPDLRLSTLADGYAHLLDRLEGLPSAERRRLRGVVPEVAELSHALAAYGLPETLQHDDFHDGQVYVRGGRYVLLDWGDACVSHPFFTLSVTLQGVIAWGLDDVQGSVDVGPFLEAYLQPFVRAVPAVDLVAAATQAMRLGWVCRAVNGHVEGQLEQTRARLRMFADGKP